MTSLDEVLADDSIVALDIATEPSTHHRIAVPALLAGRHVLCEKPLSITVLGCRVMTEAAARGGAILAVEEQWRRGPANRLARAVIASGMLGEIHLATTTLIGGDDRIMLDGVAASPREGRDRPRPRGPPRGRPAVPARQRVRLGQRPRLHRGARAPPRRRLPTATGTRPTSTARPSPAAPNPSSRPARIRSLPCTGWRAGQDAWLAFIPSGPGQHYSERRVHGRDGSMEVPPDRTGQDLAVHLDGRDLTSGEVLAELPGFRLRRGDGAPLPERRPTPTGTSRGSMPPISRSRSGTSAGRSSRAGRPRWTAVPARLPWRRSSAPTRRAAWAGP